MMIYHYQVFNPFPLNKKTEVYLNQKNQNYIILYSVPMKLLNGNILCKT